MEDIAYLSLDAHARRCVLGHMRQDGARMGSLRFKTCETEMVEAVNSVQAKKKVLTVEEGPLSGWILRTLYDYVDELRVCDPRRNALISLNANKNDEEDAYALCELLRLGSLRTVYHPIEDDRAIFKSAVQQYLDLRGQIVALKNKIKAKYRQFGVTDLEGKKVYGPRHRDAYLSRLREPAVRNQLEGYYLVLDALEGAKAKARGEMIDLGSRYTEIRQFLKLPGVGPIGAHVFDAFIQTPHRFQTKQEVWRYCRLGVIHRESDGRRVGSRRLDRAGNSELKDMSYRVWQAALKRQDANVVKRFYEASLERTYDRTSARLNTQRKIIAALWTLWKNDSAYRENRFFPDPTPEHGRCLEGADA